MITNWEELSPRQIDALIASNFLKFDISVALGNTELEPVLSDGSLVPCYSTQIAAAWGLVRRVVEEKYSIAIDFLASEKCWRCMVHDEKLRAHRALETTPERAICKALLVREGVLR